MPGKNASQGAIVNRGKPAAAESVGGARRKAAPGKGAVVASSRPSSGRGNATAMGFYTDESSGLKLTPFAVLSASVVFIVVVILLHVLTDKTRK